MIKIAFFITFLFSAYSLLACEVKVPSHLVIIDSRSDIQRSFVQQGCDEKALQEIAQMLGGVEGRITSTQLTQILRGKDLEIKITPHVIQVQQFQQIVRDQLIFPSGVQLKNTESINASGYLALASGDRIEVQCIGCLFGTGQTLNVNIQGFDGTHKTLMVRADFKKMVKAYRLTSFMPAFSNVSADSLVEEYVESIPHTDLVTNLETLKFYKLNKPVKAGTLLRQSDLNAVSLVKAGLKTEVIIENELVRIKTHGVSRSNGSLGEFVEVFHPQKNKKYQGRVIDINRVLVEL